MTANKHTPGPWEVVADHPQNACVSICGPHGNIATVWFCGPEASSTELDANGVWRPQPVRDATARLIASAPELLEVLREVLYEYEGGGYAPSRELIAQARAFIAKATGAEP